MQSHQPLLLYRCLKDKVGIMIMDVVIRILLIWSKIDLIIEVIVHLFDSGSLEGCDCEGL